MASSYSDIQIIECNRLHSEEARTNNNENLASWTNNLTDIVHLNPGDTVSVHSAMISERGAGQETSIEIKGIELGFEKTYSYIAVDNINACETLPSEYTTIKAVYTNLPIKIRDDTAYFTMSYYINMNGHNYIQLPRRWWWRSEQDTANWTAIDNQAYYGMSLQNPFQENDTYVVFDDFYQMESGDLGKVRNNNDRYTIMMRDATYFDATDAQGHLPDVNARDPENAVYFRYDELKELTVPKGFNSPEFLSTDLTRQLQKVDNDKIFSLRAAADVTANPDRTGFPVPMYNTIETQTYKAFNVASCYTDETLLNGVQKKDFEDYFAGDTGVTNSDGFGYLSQYQYVATKRPELYTWGRTINRVGTELKGVYGSSLSKTYVAAAYLDGIQTNIDYEPAILLDFKKFIEAQAKYPEIFDIYSDSRTPYNDGDNIDNSRWIHMNRYPNASQTMGGAATNAQLGWGGYKNPTWNASNTKTLTSVIVPIQYDPDQKDIFYNTPDETQGERTYGCFGVNAERKIVLYLTLSNGLPATPLMTMLLNGASTLELDRKLGFDQHFTAPGMCWALPYSGFTPIPLSYSDKAGDVAAYLTARNSNVDIIKNYRVNTAPYKRKLYIGADSPKINWDGTHFTISDLHTAMNRGNDRRANNQYDTGKLDITPNTDASDIVYKINPIEQYVDWTPARTPYVSTVSITSPGFSASDAHEVNQLNSNLENWQIYDALCGVNIEDFNLTENEWTGTLWELLGFSYQQFHSSTNSRISRIDYRNANDLSVITTNAELSEGDTKIYNQNLYSVPLYKNMIQEISALFDQGSGGIVDAEYAYFPPIVVKTQSIEIIADNLPTRMIRGYYTIRSNILDESPFVGGKVNSTLMPIIATVDKAYSDGDFVFGSDSGLEFTITRPMRLSSISVSIHDPDGSYSRTSEQNTVLLKVRKRRNVVFDVIGEMQNQTKK